MATYLRSGWNIADHLQLILLFICIVMWIDVASSPPALVGIDDRVKTAGFNDDTLKDEEVFQLTVVAQKYSAYLLVTSVHIFVLILKASMCSHSNLDSFSRNTSEADATCFFHFYN
jgi:hypothetical protein